jgi:endonuclease YncB( thermonuclease family)
MTKRMRRGICFLSPGRAVVLAALAIFSMISLAQAQVMPPPHSAPRTPVNRQSLPEHSAPQAPPRDVQGQALILDGEKLRIGEAELRLFGIVPPQLSASFGPQARAALDSLTQGQNVACHVRDRDHDGRLLAICQANGADLALELLRRGLAVAARGSLANTELLQPYLVAEQAAQNQKVGLWSVSVPSAVPLPAAPPEPAKIESTPPATAPAPPVIVEAKKEPPREETKTETAAAAVKNPAPVNILAPTAAPTLVANAPVHESEKGIAGADAGFFARFQILIAGFLMLATALGILVVFGVQRRLERREEMKAVAAALRGELLGARAICQTRLKSIVNDEDDINTSWPRLRSTLYQAYVGRLGWLGAGLARQVASIYGQASDYAAYYNTGENAAIATPKRHALQALLAHVEEVLPRLAVIEKTGRVPRMKMAAGSKTPITGADWTQVKPPAAARGAPAQPAAGEDIFYKLLNAVAEAWNAVRTFARELLADRRTVSANDDTVDYTTLIEQEIATMSFGEGEDEHLPGGDTKKQGTNG